MKDDIYAVWKYDGHPYFLCAEVEAIDDEGYVKAKGYRGYRFKPVTLLYGESGRRVQRYLQQARCAHKDILEAGENAMLDAHHEMLKTLGVPCEGVPRFFKSGMRYPVIGKIFRDAIDQMENNDRPTFAWHPDPDLIQSPKVTHEPGQLNSFKTPLPGARTFTGVIKDTYRKLTGSKK